MYSSGREDPPLERYEPRDDYDRYERKRPPPRRDDVPRDDDKEERYPPRDDYERQGRYDRYERRGRSPPRYARSPPRYAHSRSPPRRGRSRSPRGRSPSPPGRSPPRRRKNKWDDKGELDDATTQAVAAAQQLAPQQLLASIVAQAAGNPMAPNMMPGMMQPLQVAGRKQRELYVGNLLAGVVNPDMLKEFFTSALTACKGYTPTMGPPVACVQMSGEGKFAFVEFRDELMAVTALQLDKVELAGRPLNIGRPAGFVPPSAGMPMPTPLSIDGAVPGAGTAPMPAAGAAPGALATLLPGAAAQVNRKQRELYVGNLPVGVVNASSLKELFMQPLSTMPGTEPGPAVLNIDLAADGKFAFVEFRDEQITSVALTLFDKMELCGRPLNVGRPRGYVEPGATPSLNLPIAIPGLSNAALPAAKPAPPSGPTPTRTIRLDGMITPDMLKDDEEYKDVLEDIRLECERFGAGVVVRIPRQNETNAGACFLRYNDVAGAAKAREALHNRQFDGNSVTAIFIPESDF
uniref:RRM domain-containing protein n=1 Tax=Calcidiscus leptoporus TaxID=127549 RepID=A0A6U5J7E4_9EUKA|mmetsp:Transcript_40713/g.95078  ORF Transcript_40713/g.95078 Transcript_40713/m.95078 type:complete len:520 (+) Transcript_40713:42-1601(+)